MSDNPQEAREYDAVLGGENPPPVDAAVLGGIEGVKRRLSSKVVEVRIAALRDAVNYGDAGLGLVIEGLDDESTLVKSVAVKLLRKNKEPKVKLALLLHFEPTSHNGYNERGLVRKKLGDLQGAIDDFSTAIVRYYWNPRYYSTRGLCYQQLGDIEEAIFDFSRAIRIGKYYDAYLHRGICLESIENFENAKIDFLYAIRSKPYSVIPHYNCGLCSHELKQYQYAINYYSNAIKIDPTYPHSYMGRARTNTTLGNYQKAIEDYNFIIGVNYYSKSLKALAYNHRGAIYDTLENYQQAVDDANKAIELKHNNLERTYENRGISRYKLGDIQGALSDFTQAIAINPNYYRAYHSRGFVKSAMGNHQEAINDLNQAISLNPNYIDAYINRAVSKAKLNQFIEAIADFSRVIESNPQDIDFFYYNRAVCHLSRNDYTNAISDFTQAIEINPNYLDAYYNRGCCYFYIQEYQAAINDFGSAIKINPQYIQAYSARANTCIALGEIIKAEFDFEKVKELEE